MTAPERRRPLPAIAFIAALSVLTALVWFRVLHRTDGDASSSGAKACPTASTSTTATAAAPKVVPAPQRVSVLVLNSTQRNGIAGAAKGLLQKRGFTVTNATDDAKIYGGHGLIPGVAEIRYGPAGRAAATLLRFYLPGATLKTLSTTSPIVTVALGQKYKQLAPAATVTAALKRAHITLSNNPTVNTSTSASASCQPTPSSTSSA